MPAKETESVLGLKGGYEWNEWKLMGRGDILLLSTDGLLEHSNGDVSYVTARLEHVVRGQQMWERERYRSCDHRRHADVRHTHGRHQRRRHQAAVTCGFMQFRQRRISVSTRPEASGSSSPRMAAIVGATSTA